MGGIHWGYVFWCTDKKLEKSVGKWVEGEGIDWEGGYVWSETVTGGLSGEGLRGEWYRVIVVCL